MKKKKTYALVEDYVNKQFDDPDMDYSDKGINWLHKTFNKDVLVKYDGGLAILNPRKHYKNIFPGLMPIKPSAYKAKKALEMLLDQEPRCGHIRPEWCPVMYYAARVLEETYYKDGESRFWDWNYQSDCLYVSGVVIEMFQNIVEYGDHGYEKLPEVNPNVAFKQLRH